MEACRPEDSHWATANGEFSVVSYHSSARWLLCVLVGAHSGNRTQLPSFQSSTSFLQWENVHPSKTLSVQAGKGMISPHSLTTSLPTMPLSCHPALELNKLEGTHEGAQSMSDLGAKAAFDQGKWSDVQN